MTTTDHLADRGSAMKAELWQSRRVMPTETTLRSLMDVFWT